MPITLILETEGDAVFGQITLSEEDEEFYQLDHVHLIGNDLKFAFEVNGKRNKFLEVQAHLNENKMNVTLCSIENTFGDYLLLKDQHE